MLPFWKLVGLSLYLALFYSATNGLPLDTEQSLTTALYCCMPVVQCLFIVLSSNSIEPAYKHYKNNIGHGLLMSICGDIVLVYQDQVSRMTGGFLFTIAHLYYLRALGFKPFGAPATFVSFVVTAFSILLFLSPGLEGADGAFAAFYLFLLSTMAWRCMVRFQVAPSVVNFLACVGSLCFMASDFVLLRHWLIAEWEYARLVAVVLYYAAQLGLALSATDDFTPTGFEFVSKTS